MKKFLLVLILFNAIAASAADESDDNVKRDYYENGNLQEEVFYRQAKVIEVKMYDEMGKLSFQRRFKDNEYYAQETGNCQLNGKYKGENKDDFLLCDKKGQLITGTVFTGDENTWTEKTYKDGKQDGIEKQLNLRYADYQETPYKDGKKDGIERRYTVHGTNYKGFLQEEIPYKDGKMDGTKKTYTWDVEKLYETEGKEYKEILFEEIPYKNDKIDGVKKEYYNNGRLKSELTYKDGKEIGTIKYYRKRSSEEEKERSENFKAAIAESQTIPMKKVKPCLEDEMLTCDLDGNIISSGIIRDYDGDKIWAEFPIKNGKLDGIAKRYYNTGDLWSETSFKDGKMDGLQVIYLGDKRIKAHYKNDKPNGEVTFYLDGIPTEKIIFKDGKAIEGHTYDYEYGSEDKEMDQKELDEYTKNFKEMITSYLNGA